MTRPGPAALAWLVALGLVPLLADPLADLARAWLRPPGDPAVPTFTPEPVSSTLRRLARTRDTLWFGALFGATLWPAVRSLTGRPWAAHLAVWTVIVAGGALMSGEGLPAAAAMLIPASVFWIVYLSLGQRRKSP
ncbi:MAG: hypothetical protein MUE98_07450 [Rhodobacteraceae bacterium]|nr:hypothetical protein [Paracoccaceae bacterium]